MAYTVVPANGTAQQIVKLDANPPVRLTGWGGVSATVIGSALAPINMPTTNFLPIIRVPTNCIVQKLEISLDTAPSTSLTGSIGLTFSDAYNQFPGGDGTPANYASTYKVSGASPSIVSQSFFFYQAAITTYHGFWQDITFQNNTGNSVTDGFYVPSACNQPLWQALSVGSNINGNSNLGAATSGAAPGAFSSCQTDPGGFFDICWFETTTGVNTSAVMITLRASILVSGANL